MAIAVEEMKFCTAAAELCAAGTMLCAPMRCFAERKKIVSTVCSMTASILLKYCDILLMMNPG